MNISFYADFLIKTQNKGWGDFFRGGLLNIIQVSLCIRSSSVSSCNSLCIYITCQRSINSNCGITACWKGYTKQKYMCLNFLSNTYKSPLGYIMACQFWCLPLFSVNIHFIECRFWIHYHKHHLNGLIYAVIFISLFSFVEGKRAPSHAEYVTRTNNTE